MEEDKTASLEAQLGQAKQIAEEADKKYDEVRESWEHFCLHKTLTGPTYTKACYKLQKTYLGYITLLKPNSLPLLTPVNFTRGIFL